MSVPTFLGTLACRIVDTIRTMPGMAEVDQAHAQAPTTPAEQQDEKYQPSGVWTAFGLWLILLIAAIVSGGFSNLWSAIGNFLTFDLDAVRRIDNSLTSMLSILAATVVIKAPVSIVIGAPLNKAYGTPKSHKVAKAFTGIKHHYMQMTVIVTVEELVARGVFLGLPMWLSGGHLPTPVFYLLFLVGNSLWALIHLSNFGDKKEKKVGRVLPQFVGGVFLTIVFVNFGLLGALMVHLAFNNLLMSTMRKGIFNKGEILVIAWHGIVAAASFIGLVVYSGKSLGDLSHWFDPNGHDFVIPGWSVQHYLLAVLFLAGSLAVVAELLLFDLHPTQIEAAGLDGVGRAVVIMALAFVSFFGLQAVGVPFDTRVLIMALIFLLVRKSASGSGMSRVFWIGVPTLMLQLFTVLALGWDSAAWLIALAVAAVELPDRWLRIQDAKWESQLAQQAATHTPANTAITVPTR